MTLQKAMRVRSELKKNAEKLQEMLRKVSYKITWKETEPSAEEIAEKRNEKLYALNGMTFVEAANKFFAISDCCAELNEKIENVNKEGHNLLYKEASIKSKLAFVDTCLSRERQIEAVSYEIKEDGRETLGDYFVRQNSQSKDSSTGVICYNYPIVDNNSFGISLMDMRKKLCADLESVRDELAAFNATAQIDFTVPEDLL